MIREIIIRTINFIWIIGFAILLCSCGDDNYYNLSAEELSLLPYEIDDTIVLKKSNNDTIIFICGKKTKEYHCIKNNAPFYNNEDCFQSLNISFYSDLDTLSAKPSDRRTKSGICLLLYRY
ncbi:MAG: hypothetical protein R2764_24655 [Bacteroidales bacterium]